MLKFYFDTPVSLSGIKEKSGLFLHESDGDFYIGNKTTPFFLAELSVDKNHICGITPIGNPTEDEEERIFEKLILNHQVEFVHSGYIDDLHHYPSKTMKKSMRDFGFSLKKHKVRKLNKLQKILDKLF
jgi:hypothetical protein